MKFSEVDLAQVITAITGLVTALGIILNIWLTRRQGNRAVDAGKKAEEAVKDQKLDLKEIRGEQKTIYLLCNGTHLSALKAAAAYASRLAASDPSEANLNAATDAERALIEHMVAESRVADMQRENAKRENNGSPINPEI